MKEFVEWCYVAFGFFLFCYMLSYAVKKITEWWPLVRRSANYRLVFSVMDQVREQQQQGKSGPFLVHWPINDVWILKEPYFVTNPKDDPTVERMSIKDRILEIEGVQVILASPLFQTPTVEEMYRE